MSGYGIDPKRAALITKRMAQAFAFARDVVDTPSILDEIPTGSTLRFRDVDMYGERAHLTAYPSSERPDWWTARVTGPAQLATESRQWEPPSKPRGMNRAWSSPPPFVARGPTAEDALDSLESKLREVEQSTLLA